MYNTNELMIITIFYLNDFFENVPILKTNLNETSFFDQLNFKNDVKLRMMHTIYFIHKSTYNFINIDNRMKYLPKCTKNFEFTINTTKIHFHTQ